jgi:hypothetical protein
MPNVNPRLQVILPRDVHSVIAKLARLQGRSQSALARELLTELAPVLSRVAVTLEAAQSLDSRGRAKFVRALEAAQATVETHAGDSLAEMERAFAPIAQAAGDRRRRSRGPAGRRKTPVQ